jgi:hypothetical protein
MKKNYVDEDIEKADKLIQEIEKIKDKIRVDMKKLRAEVALKKNSPER